MKSYYNIYIANLNLTRDLLCLFYRFFFIYIFFIYPPFFMPLDILFYICFMYKTEKEHKDRYIKKNKQLLTNFTEWTIFFDFWNNYVYVSKSDTSSWRTKKGWLVKCHVVIGLIYPNERKTIKLTFCIH